MNRRNENANKGFSLVELIIVVAIMAVLVGVLAPQYMKYVERSRNSTDESNAAAFESALMVWGSETDIPSTEKAYVGNKEGTITVASTGFTIAGDQTDAIKSALKNAGINPDATTAITCVSQTAFTSYVVTVKVDNSGVVSVSTAYN